ncbi:MAG: DUF192 domain-containing protein [Alphaproteobacteria bacterium]|nr:DUF192 domain-containing protein [Alphaproteobacteria bacterium SS10]
MRFWHSRRAVALGFAMLLLAPLSAPAQSLYNPQPQTGLAEAPLSIRTLTGERHEFTVEVAETPRQQAIGMMFRRKAPRDRGMLFPFEKPRVASFWMKNTLVSLDLLFIEQGGRIATIHRRAQPQSLEPMSSGVPVIAVLELAGGEADRRDIRTGDLVEHPFFGTGL